MSMETLIRRVQKTYGPGALVQASKAPGLLVKHLSTGSVALDVALGGGWAQARMIELVGEYSSAKTTLMLMAIANFQKLSPKNYAIVMNEEGVFDPSYSEYLGVDNSRLLLGHAAGGEESFDIAIDSLKYVNEAGDRMFLGIDSLAAMVPNMELEDEMGNAKPGAHARLITKGLRKLLVELRKDLLSEEPRCTVMFLNQTRMKIGVMVGDPNTATGGKGREFYISQQIKLRRKDYLSESEHVLGEKRKKVHGSLIAFTCSKNKCGGPQGATGTFHYYTTAAPDGKVEGGTVDNATDLLPSALVFKTIVRDGNKYVDAVTKKVIGNGREAAIQALRDDPELLKILWDVTVEAARNIYSTKKGTGDEKRKPKSRKVKDAPKKSAAGKKGGLRLRRKSSTG